MAMSTGDNDAQALRQALREALDAYSSEAEKKQALLGVLNAALDEFSLETQDEDLESKQLGLQALAGLVEEAVQRFVVGVNIWAGCGQNLDRSAHSELFSFAARAHAQVARVARRVAGARSVDQYWGRAVADPTALSYAAVALHCDPHDPEALYEAALEYGREGKLRKAQQCLNEIGAAASAESKESKLQALLNEKWEKVIEAIGKGNLQNLWKYDKKIKGVDPSFAHRKAVSQADKAQIKTLLESPTKKALNLTGSAVTEELAQKLANELGLKELTLQGFAGAELQAKTEGQSNAHDRAKLIVKAYADGPLRPVSILRHQASSAGFTLGIGTWNMRAHANFHEVPSKKSFEDGQDLKSLPHKLASLHEVVSACSLQLAALQECPGRAKGFKEDGTVEKLLQSAATEIHGAPFEGWQIRAALCGNESTAFVFHESVLQMIGSPRPFQNATIETAEWARLAEWKKAQKDYDAGRKKAQAEEDEDKDAKLFEAHDLHQQQLDSCLEQLEQALRTEDYAYVAVLSAKAAELKNRRDDPAAKLPPKSPDEIASTFQRPPILALFKPSAGPDGNLRAAPHGWLAVVSVHLKAFDGSLEQTKAEVRGLAEYIVPWMEEEVALERDKYNASNIAAAPAVTTYIIMGDFNLAVDDKEKKSGGKGKKKNKNAATFGGDAWDALIEKGFGMPLLPPGQPTNMGPPVTQDAKCYDNILYRRVRGDHCVPPSPRPAAQVFPVMQKELNEMQSLFSVLDILQQRPSGLKWTEVGSEKPQTGAKNELSSSENGALATALKQKLFFTQQEWDSFKPLKLTQKGAKFSYDSYIEVDGKYFKPAEPLIKELAAALVVQRTKMEKDLQKKIFNSWSDHKPVYVHLPSET
eukprot:Tamp_05643.p1 GENE.Tamp_05643~~Tamp_05643.p1  ORF type:complete len:959 (-),score=177.84 Tamp_05643:39-2651(-)